MQFTNNIISRKYISSSIITVTKKPKPKPQNTTMIIS